MPIPLSLLATYQRSLHYFFNEALKKRRERRLPHPQNQTNRDDSDLLNDSGWTLLFGPDSILNAGTEIGLRLKGIGNTQTLRVKLRELVMSSHVELQVLT